MPLALDVAGLYRYRLFEARGEDLASLLTSTVTFYALLLAFAFLSGVQLIGEPIECWCPAETSDAMCNYTTSVCWTSKQYVISLDDAIPQDVDLKEDIQQREMTFYPLVPFILLLVALLLKLPSLLWNAFQGEEGLSISKAVELTTRGDQSDEETARAIAKVMTFNLIKSGKRFAGPCQWTSGKKLVSALGLFPMGSGVGTYQTGLFLFTRLLAVSVNVLVYPLLGYVLHVSYIRWGWAVVTALVWGQEEERLTHVFPREVLCDFHVRQMQNVHAYTVQCVLPVNLWSEKVFLALWLWLLILLLPANLHSYQYWVRKLLVPSQRLALLTKHLLLLDPEVRTRHPQRVTGFALSYLTHDSVLALRVLEMAAGNRLASVVVSHLWGEYQSRLPPARASYDTPPPYSVGPD